MLKNGHVAFILVIVVLAASAGILSANVLSIGASTPADHKEALAAAIPASVEDLGKLLFFDPRLSGDTSISCSTCHAPQSAWTDGTALSAGYQSTLYFRNTPTYYQCRPNAIAGLGRPIRCGDMDSVVRDHLAEAHFMNVDGRLMVERLRQVPVYEEAFKELYGSDVSYGKVLNAMSTFVASRNSTDHPYLTFLDGSQSALSPEAKAGLELFEGKAGCARCHSGELLSDGEMHALWVPENPEIFSEPLRHVTFRRFFRLLGLAEYVSIRSDPGQYALTYDESDRGKFRTPSLLEASRTAPYMHNGVLATLEEVVRFYKEGGGQHGNVDPVLKPLKLTEDEVDSLVAFLSVLGSSEEVTDIPELPPYEQRTLGQN